MNITRRLTESLNNKYKLEESTLSEGTDVLDKIANMLSEDLTEARNPENDKIKSREKARHPQDESLHEDYEDARGTDVYEQVFAWVEEKLEDFTGQLPVQDLATAVEGYNPDWCAQDIGDYSVQAFEKALLNLEKALTDTYFEYYDEY